MREDLEKARSVNAALADLAYAVNDALQRRTLAEWAHDLIQERSDRRPALSGSGAIDRRRIKRPTTRL